MNLQLPSRCVERSCVVRLVLAFSLALASLPAAATFPGMNGRITFMQADDAGLFQIWVANADLSSQTQVTATAGAENKGPVWAPGGSRIAFDSDRTDPDTSDSTFINDVFTIKPDGSDVVQLTDFGGFSAAPAYSPDGSLIAFEADLGQYPAKQGIYVALAADGSSVQRVTKTPGTTTYDTAPRFSPDGTQLVFTRYRVTEGPVFDPIAQVSALFVVNVDGSDLRQLTRFGGADGAGDADWSPDGTRLVFETTGAFETNGASNIFVINADGSGLTNLTHNRATIPQVEGEAFRNEGSFDPVWSPDGTKILFTDTIVVGEIGVFPPSECKVDLATINPDGSDRAFVSPDFCSPDSQFQEEEHQADWESIP